MDMGSLFARKKKMEDVATFDAYGRDELIDKFIQQKREITDNKPSLDDKITGVKVNRDKMKNQESAHGFHLLSNLSLDQIAEGKTYDGLTNQKDMIKATSLDTVPMSERKKHRNK